MLLTSFSYIYNLKKQQQDLIKIINWIIYIVELRFHHLYTGSFTYLLHVTRIQKHIKIFWNICKSEFTCNWNVIYDHYTTFIYYIVEFITLLAFVLRKNIKKLICSILYSQIKDVIRCLLKDNWFRSLFEGPLQF